MNINLLGPENKSFMVRKANDMNLPLNSDKDELMSLLTLKSFPQNEGWGGGRRSLILTNHDRGGQEGEA